MEGDDVREDVIVEEQLRELSLEELGLHRHCLNCVSKHCHVSVEPGVSCASIFCPFNCGAFFHECKADDHSMLCPNVKTACLNSSLGCQAMMRRALCTGHLQQCPANVVMCGHSVAMEDYDDHFCCGDHSHECEPVLALWRDEQTARGASSRDQAVSGLAGDQQDLAEDGTAGEAETKSSPSGPRDPLHTVPWQLGAPDENEEENEEPGVEERLDDKVPSSPAPEENLHLCNLPFGILQQMAFQLDRETLHELAVTSHFMRQVAASTLRKKGLVETRWKKVDGKWAEDGRIWRFKPAHLKPDK